MIRLRMRASFLAQRGLDHGNKRARTSWPSVFAVAVLMLFAVSWAGPGGKPFLIQMVQAAPLPDGKAAKQKPEDILRAKLDGQILQAINFDPNTPLNECLSYLSDAFQLKIDIDRAAFWAKDAMVDVEVLPIKLPKMGGVKLSSVLFLLLDQVDATYELRQNRLVVVPVNPKQALSDRLPSPSTTLLAKLQLPTGRAIVFDANTPLSEGLGYLSDLYQLTFVVDEKAFRKVEIQEARYQPVRLSTPPIYSIGFTLKLLLVQLQGTYRVHEEFILVVPGSPDFTVSEAIEFERGRQCAFCSFLRAESEIFVKNNVKALQAEMTLGLLMAGLKDRDPIVRAHAAGALGERGTKAGPAVSVLRSALKDPDESVRGMAATALGKIGPAAWRAVPTLAEALKDKARFVRRAAVQSLGQLGTDASSAIPALAESLKDEDWVVRGSAARVLGELRHRAQHAVPALAEALDDKDCRVRDQAVLALRLIGPPAVDAIPSLIRCLDDKDESFRTEVSMTLRVIRGLDKMGTLGPGAAAAAPALMPIRGSFRVPLAPLIEALSHGDASMRDWIVEALARTGRQGVPELIVALKHQDHRVRHGAADSLGMIGLDAKAAQPTLLRLMGLDEEPTVRKAAEQALHRIQRAK